MVGFELPARSVPHSIVMVRLFRRRHCRHCQCTAVVGTRIGSFFLNPGSWICNPCTILLSLKERLAGLSQGAADSTHRACHRYGVGESGTSPTSGDGDGLGGGWRGGSLTNRSMSWASAF